MNVFFIKCQFVKFLNFLFHEIPFCQLTLSSSTIFVNLPIHQTPFCQLAVSTHSFFQLSISTNMIISTFPFTIHHFVKLLFHQVQVVGFVPLKLGLWFSDSTNFITATSHDEQNILQHLSLSLPNAGFKP